MARVSIRSISLGFAALVASSHAFAQAQPGLLVVDNDDDNADRIVDSREIRNVDPTDSLSQPISSFPAGAALRSISPDASGLRVLVDGSPISVGTTIPRSAKRVAIQAIRPGSYVVDFGSIQKRFSAIQIIAIDGAGKPVDFTTSHASFQRTPPDRVDSPTQITNDPDALRFVVAGPVDALPARLRIVSRSETGSELDVLPTLAIADVPCPSGLPAAMACKSSFPIRVVADAVDRTHQVVANRSITADLAGGLLIDAGFGRTQQIRIGGPRQSRLGPMLRYRGEIRVHVVRLSPGGDPSIGSNDQTAIAIGREQIAVTNFIWSQCGISFGPPEKSVVRVVDPPTPNMLAVGCDLGAPSTGGKLQFRVDGKEFSLTIASGLTPLQIARSLARQVESKGLQVAISSNARIDPGAFPAVDLLFSKPDGTPATVTPHGSAPLSSDPSLGLCIPGQPLSEGLRHFADSDSMGGTPEERLLLKSFDDRDPSSVDIVVVPAFARGGRIGESFIGTDNSSVRNVVILDRTGVRAGRSSYTLAHELGHVLMDIPGHPDDWGVDTPSLLMDSDAADPSAFGPRRLSVAECERTILQSGPNAPTAALRVWPWSSLPKRVLTD